MRHLDLFSGIGGFALAAKNVGWNTIGFCEIDPWCRKILNKHWPGVPIYEDITKYRGTNGSADIITGGFPCQDISHAGKQAGIEGERSGLWSELARIIGEIRPRYAVVENVAALLSGDSGRWFQRVLGDLAEVGYDCEWHCLSAADAVQAPHQRDRVWIIAYPNSEGISRLVKADDIGAVGSRGWSGEKNLQFVDWTKGCADRPKPLLCRMDDGLSDRVDRLKGLGNSIVPACAEIIFRAIERQEIRG